MPPKLLVDLSAIDLQRLEYSIEEIRKVNPQRYEFEQLTGIIAFRPEEKFVVGVRRTHQDEFWVRGHVPGRPLLPGVLMIEAAAQLCSFYTGTVFPGLEGLYGFGGVEQARFRGTVTPGDVLVLIARPQVLTPNRSFFLTQGVVGDRLVFDASVLGVRLR
jgi:3-hydroxyacyl-[acyl-carrier-protein] dehydratase